MFKKRINLPNYLTILRMIMVIPFIVTMLYVFELSNGQMQTISYQKGNPSTIMFLVSGAIFFVAMATDWLDGYLARKNKQVTSFGKLFDPLADKIMTTSAMIMLSVLQIVPIYLTIIFVIRDLIVDGSRNLAALNRKDVAASWWGKAKTMVQSFALVIIFFVLPAIAWDGQEFGIVAISWKLWMLNILLVISAILSIISGWQYLYHIRSLINLS